MTKLLYLRLAFTQRLSLGDALFEVAVEDFDDLAQRRCLGEDASLLEFFPPPLLRGEDGVGDGGDRR